MEIEVYADVLFFINFTMVYFILWIVSKITRRYISKKRMLAASAGGALIYCLLIFFVPYGKGINFLTAISNILLSVFICFKPKRIMELLKLFILTNISAFLLGGGGIAFFYYTSIGEYIGNALAFGIQNLSIKLLLLFFFLFYIVLNFIFIKYKELIQEKQSFADLRIKLNNKKLEFRALIDTGNSMKEPCENKAVIIAEFEGLKTALPEKIRLLYYENKQEDLTELISAIEEYKYIMSFRIIPFSSLGKSNGFILAIKAESVEVRAEKSFEIISPFIAICKNNLSMNKEFNSIISPELLANQEV